MAISNYTELQSAVADFLARSDLTAKIPDFIAIAEARLSHALRAHEMQTTSEGSLTAGVIALPSDYIEWLSARWIGTRTADLAYVEPDSPEWRFRYRPNGDPTMFTIMAGNVETRPVAAGNLKLYYYQSIPDLASNSTNWLLTKCPDIYLYTSLGEANIYMKDEARAGEYLKMANNEADKVSLAADASKFRVDPSRAADTGAGTERSAPVRAAPAPAGG
jgi:hypothetical protein